jgi:hypothetical protein
MNICLQQNGPSARSGGSRHATANRVRGPDNAAPAVSGRMPPRQGVQVFSARVWVMIRSFGDRSHRARYRASRPLQESNMRIDPLDDLAVGRRFRWETPAGFLRFPNVGQSPLGMPSDIPGSLKWPELDCDARFVERARSRPVSSVHGRTVADLRKRTVPGDSLYRRSLQEVSTGELICDC